MEDEKPAADELAHLLTEWPESEIVGIAQNGLAGIDMAQLLKPDVLFLDIEMPGMSGLDVARNLLAEESVPEIVFVTAYDEFALRAFEVHAIDYLVKPVEPTRLASTMSRLQDYKNRSRLMDGTRIRNLLGNLKIIGAGERPIMSVPSGDRFIPIYTHEIILVTAEDRGVLIVTDKGEFKLNESFNQIIEILSQDSCFFQTHRAFVINLKRIVSVDLWFHNTYQLKMEKSEIAVPVSRSRVSDFREIMNIHS